MRILFVSTFSLPDSVGGTQVTIAHLARVYRERGHEVALFGHTFRDETEVYCVRRLEHEGMPIAQVRYDFSDARDFEAIYRNERIEAVFERELLAFAPDVLHVHHLTCLSTGIIDVAKGHAIPIVLTLYDFWMGCPRGQRIQDDLTLCETIDRTACATCCARLWPHFFADEERRSPQLATYDAWIRAKLAQVDLLIAPSEHTRSCFAQLDVTTPVRIIGFGVEPDAYRAVPRTTSDLFRLAYIGSVIPPKGAHILVDAFQSLDPAGIRLSIHGEASGWHQIQDYGEQLRARCRGTHDVRFTGRYDPQDVARLLAEADALVVPGVWFETYCITIREGFHAGIPVIAARLGAMAEAIEHDVTGLHFEPGDANDLARQIVRLRDERGLCQRLVESSPKNTLSAGDMADRTLACYRELL